VQIAHREFERRIAFGRLALAPHDALQLKKKQERSNE
jgi:hypothetical protein